MKKRPDLSELTEEELVAELARRRLAAHEGSNLYTFELSLEADEKERGGIAIQAFFDEKSEQQTEDPKACPKCGKPARLSRRWVRRKVRSRHGVLSLQRHYHRCEACKKGFYPLDAELNLPANGELTERLEELLLDFGLHTTFEDAAERFSLHHGGSVSENLVRRVVERVGKRAEKQDDLAKRSRPPAKTCPDLLVVQVDGSMVPTRGEDPWREVKVGLVARAEHIVKNKKRGLITAARFVARLGHFTDFKDEMQTALTLERAWDGAHIAFIGDGAPWVWNMADEVCPGAVQILDYPHALEYAHAAAKAIFEEDSGLRSLFVQHIERELWAGGIESLIHELESVLFPMRGGPREGLTTLIRYYRTNASRMRYDRYRGSGLPCGSGAIESAHRHVIQKRMKLAGQHWAPERADRLARLRAVLATAGPRRVYRAACA